MWVLLADAEAREHTAEHRLGVDPARQPLQRPRGQPHVLGGQLGVAAEHGQRASQMGVRLGQQLAVTQPGHRPEVRPAQRAPETRASSHAFDRLPRPRTADAEDIRSDGVSGGNPVRVRSTWQVGLGQQQKVAGTRQVRRLAPAAMEAEASTSQSLRSGRFGPGPCPPHALGLDLVAGLAQTRHVGQQHAIAGQHQRRLDQVARRARPVGDDHRVAVEQSVHQADLAGVGRADQGYAIALANPLAARIGQGRAQVRLQRQERPGRPRAHRLGQILIREVDRRLELGQGVDQLLTPRGIARGQGALELGQGLPPPAPSSFRRPPGRRWPRPDRSSSLPFWKARRLNSPGSASLRPWASGGLHHSARRRRPAGAAAARPRLRR